MDLRCISTDYGERLRILNADRTGNLPIDVSTLWGCFRGEWRFVFWESFGCFLEGEQAYERLTFRSLRNRFHLNLIETAAEYFTIFLQLSSFKRLSADFR